MLPYLNKYFIIVDDFLASAMRFERLLHVSMGTIKIKKCKQNVIDKRSGEGSLLLLDKIWQVAQSLCHRAKNDY